MSCYNNAMAAHLVLFADRIRLRCSTCLFIYCKCLLFVQLMLIINFLVNKCTLPLNMVHRTQLFNIFDIDEYVFLPISNSFCPKKKYINRYIYLYI